MYNIASHYENIYQYLQTIITDPRIIYLHPFGSTQPENIESLRNEVNPPTRRGPLFIFYDQEPLHSTYNQKLFDHITATHRGPRILISTERDSVDKDLICQRYKFAHVDYFFHIFAATDWYRGHKFLTGIVHPKNRTINKSFITFNRLTSGERVYRSLFVNELYKRDLLNHGHVSFSKDCPDGGRFDHNLLDAVKNQNINPALVNQAIENISQLPDLRIDFENQYIPNQSMILSPLPQLMESFVFVATETCYWQTKTHLTEKIFKPIVLRMPFILVGCANNLEYLRSYGFQTFSDYWDESYDLETDPIRRLELIAGVLQKISKLTPAQQMSMLQDMDPILEHNYQLFNDPKFVQKEWNHLKDSLTEICQNYNYSVPHRLNLKNGQAIPLGPT